MRNLYIILLICACILMPSCKENRISTMVESMTGQPFIFNEADCLILHKGDTAVLNNNTLQDYYEYVFYYDSTQCSSCALNNIDGVSELKEYIAQEHLPVRLTFVFAPSTGNMDSFEEIYMQSVFEEPVLVDKDYNIEKQNGFIPKEHMYHSFLTDKSGKIILVGSPLRNTKLKELMKQLIVDVKS